MDTERLAIAQEFKKNLSSIIHKVADKIKSYDEPNPFPKGLIDLGLTLFETSMCPEKMIESFLIESFPEITLKPEVPPPGIWDFIRERDEKTLIDLCKKTLAQQCPLLKTQGEEILQFVLDNRTKLVQKEFEDQIWKDVDGLVKISIKYCHLRRHQRPNPEGVMKYTQKFVPAMSVKKECEKWGVEL